MTASTTPTAGSNTSNALTASERKSVYGLSGLYAARMLGLFMILPVFSLYVDHIKYATPALIGFALGIYGLVQALLQIPFGMMSDKFGRKPILVGGLLLFALGSVVAAMSHNIYGIIAGRALQGAGAIGSTIMAFLADLTRAEQRTKAMALIGMTIGTSFIVAMIAGPIVNSWFHLSGIFWLTAILAVGGIAIVATLPTPVRSHHSDVEITPKLFKSLLRNPELLRLNFGIGASHAMLTATFIAIPIALVKVVGITSNHQAEFYIPVLVAAFLLMVPFIIIAERKHKMKPVFLGAITLIGLAQIVLLTGYHSIAALVVGLLMFFTAFTLMEATLPSMVSKLAPAATKGTAMGIYSSCQFFGIFVGGTLGGWIFEHYHLSGIFIFCAILSALWLLIASPMKAPPPLRTQMLTVGEMSQADAKIMTDKLLGFSGVEEAVIIPKEGIAYLKVESKIVDMDALLALSKS